MIPAGRLRHRVRIVRPEADNEDGRDANGQPVSNPQTVATVWAEVRPLSGGETFVAQQQQISATLMVSIRYRGDVAARWWFEYDDPGTNTTRTFFVVSADSPDERREDLNCFCNERAQAG